MATKDPLPRLVEKLTLRRLGDSRPAGLAIASLPLPRRASAELALDRLPTYLKPLGQWYDTDAPSPRRLLLIADIGGEAAETLKVTGAAAATPAASPPTAEEVIFAHADAADLGHLYWERPLLRLAWGGRWVGLAMGMRVKGEVHWWEHANLVTLRDTPLCREVEMGGAIPYEIASRAQMDSYQGKDNPFHHRHNWLNGHIYARLHANGVCEVFARHVNAMFVDDGADLLDAVSVLGIRVEGGDDAVRPLVGAWNGARGDLEDLRIGSVRFDLTEPARLATPTQPGRMDLADGFLAWEPYQGVELYSGAYAKHRTGDPFLFHAEGRTIPRGMARTLRFSLSLSDDRPPRVARYLAPAAWYGACEELQAEPLLPVKTEYDAAVDDGRMWFRKYMLRGGFEDGEFPNQHEGDPAERRTPATEGDVPGLMFLAAYRSGDPIDYDCAMRASYCFTDVFIDHAAKRVRMQDYTPPAVALPLQRVQGTLTAWLETGDDFCLRAAQAVVDTAYHWHKNSWPRRAVGRDARFVHSAILLYRYLGDRHALAQARDTIRDVGAAQWPNGSFGDQGGGSGIHGQASYVSKPWMGWLATLGVVDYLELFPDDEEAFAIVKRFVDWAMSERSTRKGKTGREVHAWTYQHNFKGKPIPGYAAPEGPTITAHQMHMDYMARVFTLLSLKTGDPSYFEAFTESYAGLGPTRTAGYWELPSALQFIPWMGAKLWNARLTPAGTVEARPAWFGPRTPTTGVVSTLDGEVELRWDSSGAAKAPRGRGVKVIGERRPEATGVAGGVEAKP